MNDTFWLTLVAVGGTLAGTVLAPFIAERMRRTSYRAELLMDRRLAAYADLLRVAARSMDNARDWAVFPDVDLTESDPEELNQLIPQVRIVAGPEVYKKLKAFVSAVHVFKVKLTQLRMGMAREKLKLADAAVDVRAAGERLEEAIREEMSS
jgi:hypothetical protein